MARHPVKMTDYYFEETFDDGEKFIVFFDTPEEMFYEAAKFYAFDDLDTGMKITKISCEGDLCHYVGYQLDMLIEFVWDDSGETVWSGQFPEWDH